MDIQAQAQFSHDEEISQIIAKLFKERDFSPLEALNQFPIFARRTLLRRFISLYELFSRTINLPGDIVEVGVFRGWSLMCFANFLEVRNIGDRAKRVWGFDNFSGFTEFTAEDGAQYPGKDKVAGGFSAASHLEELKAAIEIFDRDRFIPWKKRIELVNGDVCETIPQFVKEHSGLRISLLNLDVDLYKPTLVALEHLYPLVVPGGVIILDEYGILEWGGESKAVEEFFSDRGVTLQKLEWVSQPGAFIVKPGTSAPAGSS